MRRLAPLLLMAGLCFGLGASLTFIRAHGGGLDACGGHNDRKHGGYHVHNWTSYCACHPDAVECASKKTGGSAAPSGSSTPLTSSSGAGNIVALTERVQKLEERVEALEKLVVNR